MKVAISSSGKTPQAGVDARFGRCAFFAFYDTESKELEFEKNPNQNVQEGAGPASVSFVAQRNVQKVISGEFGFKIKNMLNDLHIQMIIARERSTIQDIVNLLNQ